MQNLYVQRRWLLIALVLLIGVISPYRRAEAQTRFPVITPQNAANVGVVAKWGKGRVIKAVFSADNKTLFVATTAAIWAYNLEALDSTPRVVDTFPHRLFAFAASPVENVLAVSTYDALYRVDFRGEPQIQQLDTSYLKNRIYDGVYSVAFSPDGKSMATGGFEIRFWDAKTGKPTRALKPEHRTSGMKGMGFLAERLAYSADGKWLAAGGRFDDTAYSRSPAVLAWNLSTGSLLSENKAEIDFRYFTSPDNEVNSDFAFRPDQKAVLWTNSGSEISVMELPSGKISHSYVGHSFEVNSIAYSKDGKWMASAGIEGIIHLKAPNTTLEQNLIGHTSRVFGLAFSADNRLLASVANDDTVRLWDVMTGRSVKVLDGFQGYASLMQISPNSNWLAVKNSHGAINLWDRQTGTRQALTPKGESAMPLFAYSPDSKTLAWITCPYTSLQYGRCTNSRINLFSPGQLERAWRQFSLPDLLPIQTIEGGYYEASNTRFAFSPDGTLLALAGGTDLASIAIWDVATGGWRFTLTGHPSSVLEIAFNPKRNELISRSERTILIHELEQGKLVRKIDLPNSVDAASRFEFDTEARPLILLVAREGKDLTIWDIEKETVRFRGSQFAGRDTLCRPKQSRLILERERGITVLNILTGEEVLVDTLSYYETFASPCFATFNQANVWVFTGKPNGQLHLWDMQTKQELAILNSGKDSFESLVFSPDGTWFATSGRDGVIQIWAVNSF